MDFLKITFVKLSSIPILFSYPAEMLKKNPHDYYIVS